MFVRAYDKINSVYYKSMVYGIFNLGYSEKAILLNPVTKSFELVDYLDKEQGDLKPLYEMINSKTEGWISREGSYLIKFNHYCKEKGLDEKIKLFRGYTDVFDDFDFMVQVLRDKKVSDASVHIYKSIKSKMAKNQLSISKIPLIISLFIAPQILTAQIFLWAVFSVTSQILR